MGPSVSLQGQAATVGGGPDNELGALLFELLPEIGPAEVIADGQPHAAEVRLHDGGALRSRGDAPSGHLGDGGVNLAVATRQLALTIDDDRAVLDRAIIRAHRVAGDDPEAVLVGQASKGFEGRTWERLRVWQLIGGETGLDKGLRQTDKIGAGGAGRLDKGARLVTILFGVCADREYRRTSS